MPVCDGTESTRLIRDFEKSGSGQHPEERITTRVPIIATSASLLEKDRQQYTDSGFDGWILKPIDIQRLDHLLKGTRDYEQRTSSVYKPGMWGRGGWFGKKQTVATDGDV